MWRAKAFCIALCAFIASQQSCAQEDISLRDGRYEVFYSAFNTTFISPEVAKAAGIVRAKDRGLLNISVVEYSDEESEQNRKPVKLKSIEGEVYDLLHNVPIRFSEVVEPDARYYLGTFRIASDNEFKRFRIKVLPEGETRPIEIEFQRRLFID